MLDQGKIRLMSRLAILEKEKGKRLNHIRRSFRSDYYGIPLLKNGLRITAVFLVILCLCIAGKTDLLLEITAHGDLKLLGIGVLAAYIVVLLISLIITFLCVSSRYYRDLRDAQEYERMLKELDDMEKEGRS